MLNHTAHLSSFAYIVGLVLLATACSKKPETAKSTAPTKMTTKQMSLKGSEVEKLNTAFAGHFKLNNGNPIGDTELEVTWSAIESWIGNVNDPYRGLVFHLGLNSGAMVLGVQFVPLKEENQTPPDFTYKTTGEVVVWDKTGLAPSAIPFSTWQSNYVTNKYFGGANPVMVRPQDANAWFAADPTKDVTNEMFPYELEILRLYEENLPPSGYSASLVCRASSEYEPTLARYAHKLSLHIRHRKIAEPNVFYDRLSEFDRKPDLEFDNHGADLGNLCPPSNGCGKYTIQPAKLREYYDKLRLKN